MASSTLAGGREPEVLLERHHGLAGGEPVRAVGALEPEPEVEQPLLDPRRLGPPLVPTAASGASSGGDRLDVRRRRRRRGVAPACVVGRRRRVGGRRRRAWSSGPRRRGGRGRSWAASSWSAGAVDRRGGGRGRPRGRGVDRTAARSTSCRRHRERARSGGECGRAPRAPRRGAERSFAPPPHGEATSGSPAT